MPRIGEVFNPQLLQILAQQRSQAKQRNLQAGISDRNRTMRHNEMLLNQRNRDRSMAMQAQQANIVNERANKMFNAGQPMRDLQLETAQKEADTYDQRFKMSQLDAESKIDERGVNAASRLYAQRANILKAQTAMMKQATSGQVKPADRIKSVESLLAQLNKVDDMGKPTAKLPNPEWVEGGDKPQFIWTKASKGMADMIRIHLNQLVNAGQMDAGRALAMMMGLPDGNFKEGSFLSERITGQFAIDMRNAQRNARVSKGGKGPNPSFPVNEFINKLGGMKSEIIPNLGK